MPRNTAQTDTRCSLHPDRLVPLLHPDRLVPLPHPKTHSCTSHTETHSFTLTIMSIVVSLSERGVTLTAATYYPCVARNLHTKLQDNRFNGSSPAPDHSTDTHFFNFKISLQHYRNIARKPGPHFSGSSWSLSILSASLSLSLRHAWSTEGVSVSESLELPYSETTPEYTYIHHTISSYEKYHQKNL